MVRASRILEIGTLGGYSTIWLARALPPQGRLVTLEADPRHAEVARGNFGRAGLADRIDLRVGAALDTLPILATEGGAPFDFVFIDADKPNNSAYFSWALRLSRSGAVIVVDNVVREGAVADPRAAIPTLSAFANSSTCSRLSRASARPRCRRSASRAGMGWRSPS